jgi:hypothetical protein
VISSSEPLRSGERVVDVVADVAAQEDRDVVAPRDRLVRVAREPLAVDERGLLRAEVVREVALRRSGTKRSKYGSPQATVTPSPAGVGCVVVLEPARISSSVRCASRRLRVGRRRAQ